VHRLQAPRIEPVPALLAFWMDIDEPDLTQNPQMLRDGGLIHSHRICDVRDNSLTPFEEREDLPSMGLRDRIEGVSGSPGTSHVCGSYAYIGKCQLPEISEGMTGPSPAF
jgi:hypothetical protein